jgi:protein-disulfide isomerase
VLELAWSMFFFWPSVKGELHNEIIPVAIICILLPMIVWGLLKPVLLNAKDAPTYRAAYKRLMYNPEMFSALLHQQREATDGWQNLGLSIGNPNAKHTIIKVCNPYCGPCAKTHPVLEEIITHNPDYNLRIIFNASNHVLDKTAVVVRHFLAVAEKGDAKKTEMAVDEWYRSEKKNYEDFAAKYPMNCELKLQDHKIEAMSRWCQDTGVTYTPTIFVNGRRLPETYSVEELKNIL